MSLPIRFRAPAGERSLELKDRDVDHAATIGQGSSALLRVKGEGLAAVHCALYVQDGAWTVADLAGTNTTRLNGRPIFQPTPLNIGDVLSLGTGPGLEIDIDPAKAARGLAGARAAAEEAHFALHRHPALVAGTTPSSTRPLTAPPQPGALPTGFAMPAAPRREPLPSRNPGQHSSATGLLAAACLLLAVGASTGIALHLLWPRTTAVTQQVSGEVAATAAPDPSSGAVVRVRHSRGGNRAELADRLASGDDQWYLNEAQRVPPMATAAALAPAAAPATVAATEPGEEDEAWNEVERVHNGADQAMALARYDDYRHQHPNTPEQKLASYREDAFDRLWWEQINVLLARQNKLRGALSDKKREMAEERSASFKKTLTNEKQDLESQLAAARQGLADMGYATDERPDLSDSEEMARLRENRDAARYEAWKRQVGKYIIAHHGIPPWSEQLDTVGRGE